MVILDMAYTVLLLKEITSVLKNNESNIYAKYPFDDPCFAHLYIGLHPL